MSRYWHVQLPYSLVHFGTSHSTLQGLCRISTWNTVENYFVTHWSIPQKLLDYGRSHKSFWLWTIDPTKAWLWTKSHKHSVADAFLKRGGTPILFALLGLTAKNWSAAFTIGSSIRIELPAATQPRLRREGKAAQPRPPINPSIHSLKEASRHENGKCSALQYNEMEGNTPVISGNDRRSITNSSNNSSGSIRSNIRSSSETAAAKQRQQQTRSGPRCRKIKK